jgi:2-dehydro-3-deoxy-D-arabinonate dehydratase
MRLYRTKKGNLLENQDKYWLFDKGWDELINRNDLYGFLANAVSRNKEVSAMEAAVLMEQDLLAPIGSQEVWAAGVTYLRSRDARMEESKESGGASFYDKVYAAERPELFFKSQPHRVAAHGEKVYIRRDSTWNVPEPELTLFINLRGQIQGYTIGNDMSSRSIEGETPLYLPQAKVSDRSAALGPGLYVPPSPIAGTTVIRMSIRRGSEVLYRGEVAISQIKRSLTELANWLYRESDFPAGCFLMTGTCLVPANDFTLQEGDNVEISIDGIGTLANSVSFRPNGRNN